LKEAEHLNALVEALLTIPELNKMDCELLLDGLGSLQQICMASVEDILAVTPLKRKKAEAIVSFFRRNKEV
jgi:ERCC4-type nuclease